MPEFLTLPSRFARSEPQKVRNWRFKKTLHAHFLLLHLKITLGTPCWLARVNFSLIHPSYAAGCFVLRVSVGKIKPRHDTAVHRSSYQDIPFSALCCILLHSLRSDLGNGLLFLKLKGHPRG